MIQTTHDIVKAQGGELWVETKEGKGSEFIIWLPYYRMIPKRDVYT